MAPDRRVRRGRAGGRWGRAYLARGRIDPPEDTIVGQKFRRVLDSYCPFCASDIRSAGPRRLVRCPNVAICGKVLPIDDSTCPNCCHYTRPGDNFCRVCRANLRGVLRGRGGLYQQLRRAPSPLPNCSPPREAPPCVLEDSSDEREDMTDDDEEQSNNGAGSGGSRGRVVFLNQNQEGHVEFSDSFSETESDEDERVQNGSPPPPGLPEDEIQI